MRKRIAPAATLLLLLLLISSMAPGIMPAVSALTGSRTTIQDDDFESSDGGYTHGGANDEWEWGTPTDGPGYCHSGTKCWATDLDNNFEDESNSWLRTPLINLTGAQTAILEFYQWYDLLSLFFSDVAYVEISNNSGQDYVALANYTGDSGELDWHKAVLNISDHVGNTVYIRFRLYSDEFFTDSGWFIDDVKVRINEDEEFDVHDIAVTDIKHTGSPTVGKATKITVTVTNNGDFKETNIDLDLTITDPDDGTKVFSDSKNIDELIIGGTVQLDFVWTPGEKGMYTIEADAFLSGDAKPEDNTRISRIQVRSNTHDIAVIVFQIDPESPTVGTIATLFITVKNVGENDETDITLDLRINDSTGKVVSKDSVAIASLAIGMESSHEFVWKPDTAGTYEAMAHAKMDGDGAKNNNKKTMTIIVPAPGYDLAVTEVSISPADTGPGEKRTVLVKVTNIGSLTVVDFDISYQISDGTSVVDSGTTEFDQVDPGQTVQYQWDHTPSTDGNFKLTGKLTSSIDTNPNNDEVTITFTVPKIDRDVGIESLSASPRTAAPGIKRTIIAEVGNYGDSEENFKTEIIISMGGVQVMYKDFDVFLDLGDTLVLNTEFTPTEFGNYSVEARTKLDGDTEPSNDDASTYFLVSEFVWLDISIEELFVTPLTSQLDIRTMTIVLSNLGTATVDDILVTLNVKNETGGYVHNYEKTLSMIPGEQTTLESEFTPTEYGNYTLEAEVTCEDDFTDNNEMDFEFYAWELGIYLYEAGVDKITIEPRTDALIERNITVLVSNNGFEIDGSISLVVGVFWTGGSEEIFNGTVPEDMDHKREYHVSRDWTPPATGTYRVDASVSILGDPFPENDQASMEFYAVQYDYYDLCLEDLRVEPRTDYAKVPRLITASVTNLGDHDVSGTVNITVRDGAGLVMYTAQDVVEVPKGGVEQFIKTYTPPKVDEYKVEARVIMIDHEDVEPENDILVTTFIAKTEPPPVPGIDVLVVEITYSPSVPVMVGTDLEIIIKVRNLGNEEANGIVDIRMTDPEGTETRSDQPVRLGPKGTFTDNHEIVIKFNPVTAGHYTIVAKADFTDDENGANDKLESGFDAISGGSGRDVAITSLDIIKKSSCTLSFDIKANIVNKGIVAMGGVQVKLVIKDKDGPVHEETKVLDLVTGASELVPFNHTVTDPGAYEFTVTVTAPGDENATNNAMSQWATACDPTKTDISTEVANCFLWAIAILLLVIVPVTIYNILITRKRKGVNMEDGADEPYPEKRPIERATPRDSARTRPRTRPREPARPRTRARSTGRYPESGRARTRQRR